MQAIQFLETIEAGAGISEPVRFSIKPAGKKVRFSIQAPKRPGLESFSYHSHVGTVDSFAYTRYSITFKSRRHRRGAMISFLKFDNRDLSMMVGLATLAGAVSGEISKALFGAPPVNIMSLGIVLAAFISGRYLASWLGLKAND